MRVQIQKWGNSFALRIPKSFAAELNIEHGSLVDLSVTEGRLVIAPVSEPAYILKDLLARVTQKNRHNEIDAGDPIGKEW
ncbi:MAG TPA: AbrB/MazE/SpoVT family DNA-binding domain-containing protein [Blastocatellia bacterium]|nr:AbrB/MazE/SpoVT family DNA-binding domain-containing protein [Blastocatellia bacterium]